MDSREFDFFRDHSRNFLEMALRTDRIEEMEYPDGYGKRVGDCGDTVEIFIQVEARRVRRVAFTVEGCLNTTACCNTVSRLAEGKSVDAAWEISPDDVVAYLQTLPPDHRHCAELCVGALYLALLDYGEHKRSAWKRMYAPGSMRRKTRKCFSAVSDVSDVSRWRKDS